MIPTQIVQTQQDRLAAHVVVVTQEMGLLAQVRRIVFFSFLFSLSLLSLSLSLSLSLCIALISENRKIVNLMAELP